MLRRVAALFAVALLSFTLTAHVALASTDTTDVSPFLAVQAFIAGIVNGAEAMIASIETEMSGIAASVGASLADTDFIAGVQSYTAAAATPIASDNASASQSAPAATPVPPLPSSPPPSIDSDQTSSPSPVNVFALQSGRRSARPGRPGPHRAHRSANPLLQDRAPDRCIAIGSLHHKHQARATTLQPTSPSATAQPNTIAAASNVSNLSGVTITDANLTASEIPALDYLSLSGGTLAGDLELNGNATTTGTSYFTGNVGIGTSTSQDALAINGSVFLPSISAPGLTTNRLYANGGSLYWAGSLIGGATTGNWTSDGTNVWRLGGAVGIGTTSPSLTPSPSPATATSPAASASAWIIETIGTIQSTGNILGGGTLALSGTTGTTTVALGQGFTIGGSQFVVQQGSGNIGIWTSTPTSQLFIDGNNSILTVGTNSSNYSEVILQDDATANGYARLAYPPATASSFGAFKPSQLQLYAGSGATNGIALLTETGEPIVMGTQGNFNVAFNLNNLTSVGGNGSNFSFANNMNVVAENIVGGFINGSTGASSYAALTIQGGAGTGTNSAGSQLNLIGGRGTGSAAGGNIVFQTAAASSSGSTLNTLVERMRITPSGTVGIGLTSPAANLNIGGNGSLASWTTTGSNFAVSANTETDNTSNNATIATRASNSFAQPTFAFTIATSTITTPPTSTSPALPRATTQAPPWSPMQVRFSLQQALSPLPSPPTATDSTVNAPTGASNNYAAQFLGGNVGIGTTSPATTLSTQGNEYTTGGLGVGLLNTTTGTIQSSGNILGGGTLALSGTTGTTTIAAGQGFTIGGSQFVVQQGSGRIGIGTTSPYSLLSISNSATTAANTPLFTIASTTGGNSTSTLMTVLASGNVGIGTASPFGSGTTQLGIQANGAAASSNYASLALNNPNTNTGYTWGSLDFYGGPTLAPQFGACRFQAP